MRTVRKGSKGDAVKTLQEALNAHGYGPLTVDGIFGSGTQRAVLQFQQAQALTADGIVGPNTWQQLFLGESPAAELEPPRAVQLSGKQEELTELLVPGIHPVARRALEAAIRDFGAKEEPLGENRGPQIAHLVDGYAQHWRTAEPWHPWCGLAICGWTAEGLGLGHVAKDVDWSRHPFGSWLGAIAAIQDWAKARGCWYRQPLPGDIFTMPRAGSSSDPGQGTRAGHGGLVVAVEGKHIHTIDGNVSDQVGTRLRKISSVSGFVRWWEV